MDSSTLERFQRCSRALRRGEAPDEDLFPIFYAELRRIAERCFRSERADHTLEPTALVHEMFLRIADSGRAGSTLDWKDRAHFLAWAATSMRRILVDHARGRRRQKRGGKWQRVPLDAISLVYEERALDIERLESALEELEQQDGDSARLVELRFFGGLTVAEAAEALGVSRATAERHWTFARAWLHQKIVGGGLADGRE